MTYAELFKAICDREPHNSFALEVQTWRHVHGGRPSDPSTTWDLYITYQHGGSDRYTGATPEEVLAKYDAAQADGRTETVERVSERVGDVP